MVASLVGPAAAAGCDPVVTPCPSALAAAQALTGNNPQLPVTNAVFSGVCGGGVEGMLLITEFGCHSLASKMPLGECGSLQGTHQPCTSLGVLLCRHSQYMHRLCAHSSNRNAASITCCGLL
jgi:hypothetical protein